MLQPRGVNLKRILCYRCEDRVIHRDDKEIRYLPRNYDLWWEKGGKKRGEKVVETYKVKELRNLTFAMEHSKIIF